MKLIDAHCHINLDEFKDDFNEVVERINKKLEFAVNIGFDMKTSLESVELAKKYDFIYSAIGIHPNEAKEYSDEVEKKLIKLAENPKVLAIGEIGLDYYREGAPRDLQKDVFRKQIELAIKLDKPILIHCRDAYGDTFDILNEYKEARGIMHSYSGSYEFAKKLMDRFYFSISGPVTFKNAKNVKEMVRELPIERIMVETDSPYLTPTPYRGKRNEPIFVEYVAREVADLKNMKYEEVKDITNKNTKKAFEIEV
ncbi:TatD family hydrolase [Haliovirga abyssi]|uniref:Hydrolase TatD n=1 Tax=Haliovirga abyssi TaxID=2996794 RepID=A0AAU9DN49_9FUSO|nr:TatD family hydrolase [Haliovirga abyssi]BDU49753.1 hydrolase TatD [Haliovirga abyssi]